MTFWGAFLAFWEAFFILKEPLWLTLGAFGLRLDPLWQPLDGFGGHLGHFERPFWPSGTIFALHWLNLRKPRNSLEILGSEAFWVYLDRDIFAHFGQREAKKTKERRNR